MPTLSDEIGDARRKVVDAAHAIATAVGGVNNSYKRAEWHELMHDAAVLAEAQEIVRRRQGGVLA